jgi:hypothetical protein
MALRSPRMWKSFMRFLRKHSLGAILVTAAMGIGFYAGHVGTTTPNTVAPKSSQNTVTVVASPSLSQHSPQGAADSAVKVLQRLFETELMSPSQRRAALPSIIGTNVAAEADLLDQVSPMLVQPLGLPANVDNRTAAYYNVAPFGDSRIISYSGDTARIVVITTSSAGTKDGAFMIDIRAIQQVDLAWSGKDWRYVSSKTLGTPVTLATAAGMGQLIQTFEGAK